MNLSRRDFLKLTGLVAASTALASCAPANRLLAPLAN
ncbi:MAG: twin-arginine translocation signal domain-containing protein, partial [Pseudomonadota bacterium]